MTGIIDYIRCLDAKIFIMFLRKYWKDKESIMNAPEHITSKHSTYINLSLYTIFNIFKALFSCIFIYIANNR